MLFETSKGQRRLFKPGDPFDPRRNLGRFTPRKDEMPQNYRELIDWYWNEYVGGGRQAADPILSLRGLGKVIWADEDADTYVERLRDNTVALRIFCANFALIPIMIGLFRDGTDSGCISRGSPLLRLSRTWRDRAGLSAWLD